MLIARRKFDLFFFQKSVWGVIWGLRRGIFWITTVKIVLNNQWEWNKQSTEKFLGQAKSDIMSLQWIS